MSAALFREGVFAAGVVLATGDVRVRLNGGVWMNRSPLPTVSEGVAQWELSETELAANLVEFRFADMDGPAFDDVLIVVEPQTAESLLMYLPLTLTVPPPPAGHIFGLRVGAQGYSLGVPITDAEGTAVDLSAHTLRLVFETDRGDQVYAVTPTVSGTTDNLLLFEVVSDLTTEVRTLRWTLWDQTGGINYPLAEGLVHVERAAVEE